MSSGWNGSKNPCVRCGAALHFETNRSGYELWRCTDGCPYLEYRVEQSVSTFRNVPKSQIRKSKKQKRRAVTGDPPSIRAVELIGAKFSQR